MGVILTTYKSRDDPPCLHRVSMQQNKQATILNYPAVVLVFFCTLLLANGTKTSKLFTNVSTVVTWIFSNKRPLVGWFMAVGQYDWSIELMVGHGWRTKHGPKSAFFECPNAEILRQPAPVWHGEGSCKSMTVHTAYAMNPLAPRMLFVTTNCNYI